MARLVLLLTAGSVAAIAFAGCLGSGSDRVGGDRPADTRVLTLLDPFSSGQETAAFDNEVARLSHGSLRIRVVEGPDRGPTAEAAAIRAMQHGRADLAFAATRAWDEFGAKRLRAIAAPFLIDSYRLEHGVLSSGIVRPMLAELRPLGLVGIAVLPGPIRHPLGKAHRLAALENFKGATIGIGRSRVAHATMRALGATSKPLPTTVTSLAGLDGVERQVQAIEGDRIDVEGSHLMTNVNLWPRPIVVFASERSYGELSAGEHRILETAARNVMAKSTVAERRLDVETARNLCRKGHVTFDTATPAELRALRRAVTPVYGGLERDPGTRAAIAAVRSLKRRLAAPPSVVAPCHRSAAAPEAEKSKTELDGVWTMDTGESAARPEYAPENWGHWVFAFDRGRFAITQENKPSCTWGYGKFTVDGHRTEWTFTDGGGIAPTDAMNRPGEFFVFDLSAFHDTLQLAPVKGQISPLNFRAERWRRLSDDPTRRFFSKRCPPPAAALPD